jgi:ATP-dependent helicase/nuclease subunit A
MAGARERSGMTVAHEVKPLAGPQLDAVAPEETVWLSASAGTGKTQVLSSRVLRLLLQDDVEPSQILCLTFTKAGATEMAERIGQTLARWVRADAARLAQELIAIGADHGPSTQARARTLFAKVLDCPGGGLRIDTIHAFAQWLLAAFPSEAGLVPGTRPMEDRDRDLLARQVLAELLVDAEQRGDERLLEALAGLTLRMAPEDVEAWLLRCAAARGLWFGPGAWAPPLATRLNQVLGLPADAGGNHLLNLYATFDCGALRRCLEIYRQWLTATGRAAVEAIEIWIAASPPQRLETLEHLTKVLFTQKGEPRNLNRMASLDPAFADHAGEIAAALEELRQVRALVDLAGWLGPALELGRSFALAWNAAKQREGLIDFDDQIREAADLLDRSDLSDWIRYKLDRRFDHILIDEAQDTNAAQWRIIRALTGDFFAGEGAHGDKLRTLFVVGDYKQAIFRFQGTSPRNFEDARERVAAEMQGAAENLAALRGNRRLRELQRLGLGHSFRTAQVVLDFVDKAIAAIGHERFGLTEPPDRHVGAERPGQVVLWRPVGMPLDAEDDEEDAPELDEGTQTWLSRPDRDLADRIARQVREWVDPHGPGFGLAKGGARRAAPGDVMILVRKRKELAGLIVARLHAAGVPVAGVDRLRLGAPLAVKDLVGALRFAAQPLDDLNLASLLVSPLIGWSQGQLLEHGFRDKGTKLWLHLRRSSDPEVARVLDQLGTLLALADYEPPQALLHWLLVGPWRAREKLVARLGTEANDPLDELLNAAGAHAAAHVPSLAGFLAWFDAGEGELKREADGAAGLVRVMTVHGSKGLQAPIVILADATGNPATARTSPLDLAEPEVGRNEAVRAVPLPVLRKEERVGRIHEVELAAAREEAEEHWRLLYVAMTRAEEALFVGGALGLREKEPAPDSWYAQLARLFAPERRCDDPIWGWRSEHGEAAPVPPRAPETLDLPLPPPLPPWLTTPVGPEPRPPRPLAPSSLGEDESPDPPLPPGTSHDAARRGVLIHKLLERLPAVPADQRGEAAERWLTRNAADLGAEHRVEIVRSAVAVLAEPAWAELFTPAALAEAGIAAVVGGQVVAGTIDRLLVEPGRVRLVDFKTTRRPPKSPDALPLATLRQMAAYVAALEVTYPGRSVEAAVLYTHGPRLIALPGDLIAAYKP